MSCGKHSAPLDPEQGRIRLRILVDRASIEIFGNDGRLYMPIGILLPEKERSLELFARNGSALAETLIIREVKSIWEEPGFLEADFTGLQHIGLPPIEIERSVGLLSEAGFPKGHGPGIR